MINAGIFPGLPRLSTAVGEPFSSPGPQGLSPDVRPAESWAFPQHRLSEDRSASHLQAASPEGLECSRNFRFRRQSRSTVRTENRRGTHRENEDSEPAERGSRRTRRTASPGAERGALKDGYSVLRQGQSSLAAVAVCDPPWVRLPFLSRTAFLVSWLCSPGSSF